MNRVMVLLDAIRDHLDLHNLPPVASVVVRDGADPITVQLAGRHLPDVARGLLMWADTLDGVTASIWRVPSGSSVHVDIHGRTPCGLPVVVYGGVRFSETVFPDLPAGARQEMPVFVLRGWAKPEEVAA